MLPFQTSGSDRFVYTNCFVPLWAVPPVDAEAAGGAPAAGAAAHPAITVGSSPLGDLQSQLQQSFGVVFLDRIRIQPQGSILGEELLSLSLAPGEEVVTEQQTFSKKEMTYEEQNEVEQQVDLQFDATLTTGLDEGFDRQRNSTARTDLGLKADVTIPVDGIPINVGGSAQNSVTNADTVSQKFAVKQSQTSSSKVSSKYRSLHKTTLRVSTVQTFQTSNKRTLRNPNRYTPLDLRYFKLYQQVQLAHERYGVRLAWAPCITSPGAPALGRASAAYQNVINDAIVSITLPSKPQLPAVLTNSVVVDSDSKTVGANPFSTGQRTTVTLSATPPATPSGGAPYVWDGNTDFISARLDISALEWAAP